MYLAVIVAPSDFTVIVTKSQVQKFLSTLSSKVRIHLIYVKSFTGLRAFSNYFMNMHRTGYNLTPILRLFSSHTKSKSEQQILQLLSGRFPEANINVVDVSNGCGAMFEVHVESNEFKHLSVLKQHKIVNEVLKEKIKAMHGIRIHTSIPKI